jgi:hypothetical protein
MRRATELREHARVRLDEVTVSYAASLSELDTQTTLSSGWTQRASALGGRLDSAFHNPEVVAMRSALAGDGGARLADVADSFIPGRYRRYYVEAEYGRPIVSGRQLLQAQPINLKHIAGRSFDFADYELTENMIAFGAEGRAEERIAQPALITSDRAGWLANNHVMRVVPKTGVNPGWLYLALAVHQVQMQVKACSAGSVVDAVSPVDLGNVVLPPVDGSRGAIAAECWSDFAEASLVESEAIDALERAICERILLSN